MTDPAVRRAERLDEIHRTFALFDSDHDGSITAVELGKVLDALGQSVSAAELRAMVSTVDSDGNGAIEFNEFVALLLPTDSSPSDVTGEDDLRSAFADLDRNHDGQLSVAELKRALRALGDHHSDEDIDALVHKADKDGDGQVSFEEFVTLMNG